MLYVIYVVKHHYNTILHTTSLIDNNADKKDTDAKDAKDTDAKDTKDTDVWVEMDAGEIAGEIAGKIADKKDTDAWVVMDDNGEIAGKAVDKKDTNNTDVWVEMNAKKIVNEIAGEAADEKLIVKANKAHDYFMELFNNVEKNEFPFKFMVVSFLGWLCIGTQLEVYRKIVSCRFMICMFYMTGQVLYLLLSWQNIICLCVFLLIIVGLYWVVQVYNNDMKEGKIDLCIIFCKISELPMFAYILELYKVKVQVASWFKSWFTSFSTVASTFTSMFT